MKKRIEELTIFEFVALLLDFQPIQRFRLERPVCNSPQYLEGTFDEIKSQIGSTFHHNPLKRARCLLSFYRSVFDFYMPLDSTDSVKYMKFRTSGFDPDLTVSFLNDMKRIGDAIITKKIVRSIDKRNLEYQSPEGFDKWIRSSTRRYYEAYDFLLSKCEAFSKKGMINPSLFESQPSEDSAEIEIPGTNKNSKLYYNKAKFLQMLDNTLQALGGSYVDDYFDGTYRWRFKKPGQSLAYIGKVLAQKSELERVPWAIITYHVKTDCDEDYLKKCSSKMNDPQNYPTDSDLINTTIDSIAQS